MIQYSRNEINDYKYLSWLLLLQCSDNSVRSVSGDNLGIVKHVKLLCGISACIEENGLFTSGMIRKELQNYDQRLKPKSNSKRTSVTSRTWPSTMTQISSFLLCFATSSTEYTWVAGAFVGFSSTLGVSCYSFDLDKHYTGKRAFVPWERPTRDARPRHPVGWPPAPR